MHNSRLKYIIRISMMFLLVFLGTFFLTQKVYAEGTTDLGTEDQGEDGYRPYTERNKAKTFGQERLSHMQVYMKAGETVYFGTSVSKGTLYNEATASGYLFTNAEMGTNFSDAELKYLNSADIWVYKGTGAEITDSTSLPYVGNARNTNAFLIDIPSNATNTTPGFIYNGEQEAGGIDFDGTGTGYKVNNTNTLGTVGNVASGTKTNANSFTAPSDGVYSVVFFSSKLTADNPSMMKLSDKTTPFESAQKGSTIASWDITVYNNGVKQSGRVFTKTLFINMGNNAYKKKAGSGALYSNVYAVTDDGYQYKVDFNGMDPYGFVFFANSRGMLTKDSEGNTSSLYHGARSDNNQLSDFEKNNIFLNMNPTDSSDKTYNLFYEQPSKETLKAALGISDPSSGVGAISDFKFKGNSDSTENEGYVGKGGKFSFQTTDNISATSYELRLDFRASGGGIVTLSNALAKNALNTISWDGKDANGNFVGAGTYQTVKASIVLKGGEVHFPLLDVEQNVNGVKISRLNGTSPNSIVYFNNSSSNAGSTTGDWTVKKNWTAGSEQDATDGVDSSNGAMAFTNTNTANNAKGLTLAGDGDQCALDLWADYSREVSLGTWSFSLKETSFTVNKTWVRTSQTNANPLNATMTLQSSSDNGNTWNKVLTDTVGTAITNPVSITDTYKWNHLDASKMYRVIEKHIVGYTTDLGTVNGSVDTGYSQTITNTYKPAKLTITKIWNMNGSTETHPDSATVHIYTDSGKAKEISGSPFTLNSTNNWKEEISVDSTLQYYVYEEGINGYSVYGDGKASGNGDDGFYSNITNTFESEKYVSVAAFKLWTDAEDSSRPSSITMTLYKDGEIVKTDATGHSLMNPVTLSDSTGWYYIWPALVNVGDSTSGYTIKETAGNDSLARYQVSTDGPKFLNNFGYIGLDNTLKKTSFTVAKTWQENNGPSHPDSVIVHLQQSTDAGASYTNVDSVDTVTLSEKNAWTQTWADLPSYTSDNKEILYKAVEESVPDYIVSGDPSYDSINNQWSQTLLNTYKYVTLHVEKKWAHGTQNEADWPTELTVSLLADGEQVYSGVLNADNNWMGTFYEMPMYDKKGNRITYTVSEYNVEDYTMSGGTVTGNAADGYQVIFTNTHNDPATPTPSGDDDYVPPDTGDHTNTLPWGIALGVSLAAIIAAVIYRKRSE